VGKTTFSQGFLNSSLPESHPAYLNWDLTHHKKAVLRGEFPEGEKKISHHIKYFKERLLIPQYYQVHLGKKTFQDAQTGALLLPFYEFCKKILK
jgi:hypothetical protein